MEDKRLLEAFNAWEELIKSSDVINAYQACLKASMEKALITDGFEQAFEEAFKEGFKIGYVESIKKIVRKFIGKGFNNEEIMDMLDLTEEQIELLRKEDD